MVKNNNKERTNRLGGETRIKGAGILCPYQASAQTYCHVPAASKEPL